MIVEYKTILEGDRNKLHPDAVAEVKWEGREEAKVCCNKMKDALEYEALSFGEFSEQSAELLLWSPQPTLCIVDIDEDYYPIGFCPFCGQKIEYKEVLRTRYKLNVKMVTRPVTEQVEEKVI